MNYKINAENIALASKKTSEKKIQFYWVEKNCLHQGEEKNLYAKNN